MKMQDPEVDEVVVTKPAPTVPPKKEPIWVGFSEPMRIEYAVAESAALGKDYWRVLNAFTYTAPDGTQVHVPRGYLTDGASAPRPFWWLVPPMGPYGPSAAVHDILCEEGKVYRNNLPVFLTERAEVDGIFKEAMIDAQIPSWKRNVMYIFLRIYAKVCKPPVPKPDAHKKWLMQQWLKNNPQE